MDYRRLLDAVKDQQDRYDGGNDGDPEHQSEIVVARRHQQHGEQWADERADCIHCLAQSKRGASQLDGSYIANQRVAGCAPDTFADPVHEAGY